MLSFFLDFSLAIDRPANESPGVDEKETFPRIKIDPFQLFLRSVRMISRQWQLFALFIFSL